MRRRSCLGVLFGMAWRSFRLVVSTCGRQSLDVCTAVGRFVQPPERNDEEGELYI